VCGGWLPMSGTYDETRDVRQGVDAWRLRVVGGTFSCRKKGQSKSAGLASMVSCSDWPVSSAAGDIGPKVPEGFSAK
jgi:hypothetical protein